MSSLNARWSSRPRDLAPSPVLETKDELSLSGLALTELGRAVIAKGATFRFRAGGVSMAPFIKDGDVIVVDPLRGRSPGLGDIVACICPERNRLFVHRIVNRKAGKYLLQGDSVPEADGWFALENIVGRVGHVERDGKPVFSGLGPERYLIAMLNRNGLLFLFLSFVWRFMRPVVGRISS